MPKVGSSLRSLWRTRLTGIIGRSGGSAGLSWTGRDEVRVGRILKELHLQNEPSIVLIDARNDNKPSGSKA
jgi:hypothetical protein